MKKLSILLISSVFLVSCAHVNVSKLHPHPVLEIWGEFQADKIDKMPPEQKIIFEFTREAMKAGSY